MRKVLIAIAMMLPLTGLVAAPDRINAVEIDENVTTAGVQPAPAPATAPALGEISLRTVSLPSDLDSFNDLNITEEDYMCLSQAVYFEARSEPLNGQAAVAEVILNRVQDRRFPNTICGVVFQNENWRHRCQFSFACDGRSDRPRERRSWQQARKIAAIVLTGTADQMTNAATHYHAVYVQPGWAQRLERTVQVGQHVFYR